MNVNNIGFSILRSLESQQKISNNQKSKTTTNINEISNRALAQGLLKSKLYAFSPSKINSLYESAENGKVKLYSDVSNVNKEPYEFFVDRVTKHVNQAQLEDESTEELNTLLSEVSKGAQSAHHETRDVLQALSKLDPETQSYLAQSETYTRFALKEIDAKINGHERLSVSSGSEKDLILAVKTRQGDEVTISIQQNQGWEGLTFGKGIEVEYQVDGELSEEEHKALSELMNAIGQASDGLLAGRDFTTLLGINEFNGEQLASFSLNLAGSGQEISYDYSHNGESQGLQGSWRQGGEVKASFELNSELGGVANKDDLASYLELIDASTKVNGDATNAQVSLLFKNSFSEFMQLSEKLGNSLEVADELLEDSRNLANELFSQTIKEREERLGLKDESSARLKEGFNRLADFSTKFVNGKGGDKNQQGSNQDLVTGSQFEISQETQYTLKRDGDNSGLSVMQSRKYALDEVLREQGTQRDNKVAEEYVIDAFIDFKTSTMVSMNQSRSTSSNLNEKHDLGMGEYLIKAVKKQTQTENSLYNSALGDLESTQESVKEDTQRALMAGEIMTSLVEIKTDKNEVLTQFTPKDKIEDNQAVFKMNFKSKLLNEIIDSIKA